MTVDKPMNEMTVALAKTSKIYTERFDGKPLLTEILYVLELVIASRPDAYIYVIPSRSQSKLFLLM